MGERFSEDKNIAKISYVPLAEISRIRKNISAPFLRSQILADVFRLNALYMIRHTGSGHPGSTFSCADIMTWLWLEDMKKPNDKKARHADIFFSSKGHDVPMLYSILLGLEKIPFVKIHTLRRLHGLPGHPDVHTPFIAANTGSLGMGISKARGMAQANRLQKKTGRIYVLTGDGELQEGQIWEALQPTANGKFSEITVIVDRNKIQSDLQVQDTSDEGNLVQKFKSFGWEVAICDGNDIRQVAKILSGFKKIKDRPQVLFANTIKGKGVSFMEKMGEDGFYKFHSGAPTPEQFQDALRELTERVNKNLAKAGLSPLKLESRLMPISSVGQNWQRLVPAYGDELCKIARRRKDLVAMDADLVLDTGLIPFKKEFPERYLECGIAEQDMVSFAGGLALRGALPVVHSFECFLTTRANEHFYNNATEDTKIIYAGTLAGLLPGMPGHSHQSVRGISILGSIPGLTLIQPSCEQETRMAIRWAVEKNPKSTYIRLVSVPCECPFELPEKYILKPGRGVVLNKGKDVIITAYGPVMLGEALKASKLLQEQGISAKVVNIPWLNCLDENWLKRALLGSAVKLLVTLDDHYVELGQGMQIRSALAGYSKIKMVSLGLTEVPECGHNEEVLKHHKLDYTSIAERIKKELK